MFGLFHGNPGLRVLAFFTGFGLGIGRVGGLTYKRIFKLYIMISGCVKWPYIVIKY